MILLYVEAVLADDVKHHISFEMYQYRWIQGLKHHSGFRILVHIDLQEIRSMQPICWLLPLNTINSLTNVAITIEQL